MEVTYEIRNNQPELQNLCRDEGQSECLTLIVFMN